jgi:hypothetical protein
MRRVSAAALALGLFGCTHPTAAPAPTPSPTATPPPALETGDPPKKVPGGIEYHVVAKSESGTVFVPIDLVAQRGTGKSSWAVPSGTGLAFDAASDRWLPTPGAAPQDVYVDAVFPGSPQQLKITVRYAGAPTAEETFLLRYRTIDVPDMPVRVYVLPKIGDPRDAGKAKDPREPLGEERLHQADLFRWLAGGFVLRDPGSVYEATITLPSAP